MSAARKKISNNWWKNQKYQMLIQEVAKHPNLKHLQTQYQILLTKEWRNYYEIHLNYSETALLLTNLNAKDKHLVKRDIIFLQQKIAAMEAKEAVVCLPKPMITAKAVLSKRSSFKVSEINALALAKQPAAAVQKVNDKQMVALIGNHLL